MKIKQALNGEPVSRRLLFQTASLLVGGAAMGAMALGANQTQANPAKVHQSAVSYQATPKGRARCDNCTKFQAPQSCLTVEGVISPSGWCSIYAPKG